MAITGINGAILPSVQQSGQAENTNKNTPSFLDAIKKAVGEVEEKNQAAERAVQDLAVGRRKTLHETMIAMEEASISFKMMLAVRTKVLSAYQEVMRMNF